jgi:cell division protein FtsQ
MWHRPQALNRMADLLLALALCLAFYSVLHAVVHLPVFELREVRLLNRPAHLKADDVERAVKNAINGNFFTLQLAGARAAFEKLPWVRTAELRRRWPDRLEVMLEEQVPLARWGTGGLVNTRGELFAAEHQGELPVFIGPDGSAKEIAIQYEHFRRGLARIHFSPQQIEVTDRRAWRILLEGGLMLELGREHVEARLARFIGAYEHTLGRIGHRIEHVDLRYSNGFAARIPGLAREAPRSEGGRGAVAAGVHRT